MPNNKRQHFVPQHYLRQFRIQGTKQICTAKVDPLSIVGPASIRHQCQEDYFYQGDGKLDEFLTRTERDLAPVLIRVSGAGAFDTKELVALRFLAVTLHSRTRKTIEHSKLFAKRMAHQSLMRAIARGELPLPEDGLSEDMIDFSGVAATIMGASAIPCWLEMHTLECKLLHAASGSAFITSDHPVVLLNQLFSSKRSIRSFAGFSRSGFQLILPISPRLCLFFYDPKIYKVGTRRGRTVEIETEDVEIVNSLQIQNAEECIYFHDMTASTLVERLVARHVKLRKDRRSHLQEYSTDNDNQTILHQKVPSPTLPRAWSFCKIRRHTNIGADNRRDPAWTAMIEALVHDMERNPSGGDIFDRLEKILGDKIKS